MTRKYESIWETVKSKGKCKIRPASPHLALFKTIKKAVIKEKCNDITFKVENEERNFKLLINRNAKDGTITFSLQKSLSLEDL